MNMLVQKCDRCGRQVAFKSNHESTDMIQIPFTILYLCDLKKEEPGRPTLFDGASPDKPFHYCPKCLINEVTQWANKMMERGPSKIPVENITFRKY